MKVTMKHMYKTPSGLLGTYWPWLMTLKWFWLKTLDLRPWDLKTKDKNKHDSISLKYDLIQQSQEGNKDQLLHSVLWHA